MALKNYTKQHVTIQGPDGVYVGKELDAIGQSIKNLNDAVEPKTHIVLVAALPPAAANQNVRFMVTDATATTFWSIVAGSGANIVPVTSDGTHWRIG